MDIGLIKEYIKDKIKNILKYKIKICKCNCSCKEK